MNVPAATILMIVTATLFVQTLMVPSLVLVKLVGLEMERLAQVFILFIDCQNGFKFWYSTKTSYYNILIVALFEVCRNFG